jgi:hypothetical protein
MAASSVIYGYDRSGLTAANDWYGTGTAGTSRASLTGAFDLTTGVVKDAVETLATKNIPRLGETYVAFIHPHQSRKLRDNPEFIEVTKYAAPGNFMLGEIGRLYDVVFIETTQVKKLAVNAAYTTSTSVGLPASQIEVPVKANTAPGNGGNPESSDFTAEKGYLTTATGNGASVYEAIMIGDNAFGHAISLPVELRDGGVLDFGREHALAWYAIWGLGVITDQAICKVYTN